jgi:hypothetical protein
MNTKTNAVKKSAPKAAASAKGGRRARKSARPRGVLPPGIKRIKRVVDKTFDLTRYETVKSAGGNTSLDCGDAVAKQLRGKELDEVYKIVAKATNEPEKDLRKRYEHLNPGQQRMNLGNRFRGALANND